MFVDLAAGYCDTGAHDLGWSMDLGLLSPLATRRLILGAIRADLHLLGASHQVAVWLAGRPAPLCVETVACLPGRTAPLPRAAAHHLGGWRYTFASVVRSHAPGDFSRRVSLLEPRAALGLGGRYPGSPGAVTAIAVLRWRSGLRWATWHTYPQNQQIATTLSSLQPCTGGETPSRPTDSGE
jgi:hypothetical protein